MKSMFDDLLQQVEKNASIPQKVKDRLRQQVEQEQEKRGSGESWEHLIASSPDESAHVSSKETNSSSRPVMPSSSGPTGRTKAPPGLFHVGSILGLLMLWGANASPSFPEWARAILFPQLLVDLGIKGFMSIVEPFCGSICARPDIFSIITTAWVYGIIGLYYGILTWILGHLYFFSKRRSQW